MILRDLNNFPQIVVWDKEPFPDILPSAFVSSSRYLMDTSRHASSLIPFRFPDGRTSSSSGLALSQTFTSRFDTTQNSQKLFVALCNGFLSCRLNHGIDVPETELWHRPDLAAPVLEPLSGRVAG